MFNSDSDSDSYSIPIYLKKKVSIKNLIPNKYYYIDAESNLGTTYSTDHVKFYKAKFIGIFRKNKYSFKDLSKVTNKNNMIISITQNENTIEFMSCLDGFYELTKKYALHIEQQLNN